MLFIGQMKIVLKTGSHFDLDEESANWLMNDVLMPHSSLISPLRLSMDRANLRSGFYGKMEQFGLSETIRLTLSQPGFPQNHAAPWELLISISRKVLFSMLAF